MKKLFLFSMVFVLTLTLGFGIAFAVTTGNGAPSGPHYNLNIIGVSNGKTADMRDSNRHTIFVALGSKDVQVTSRIYLYRGDDFQVCDGNGFDAAFDCAGNQIATLGAVFQLPCNLNLPAGSGECGGFSNPCLVPCTEGASATYEVWARALGKPGGEATMTTCAYDLDTDTTVCSMENTLEVLSRGNGQEKFQNVTNALTSLVYYNTATSRYDRVALFASYFEDWFWQYANKGLKLAQLRFYLL